MRRAILLVCLALVATLVGPAPVLAKSQDLGGWSPAPDLKAGRAQHTATLLRTGKVLIAGGVDGHGVATASAELFDPATNRWTAAASMRAVRSEHSATLLNDGRVLVVGGFHERDPLGETLSSAEIYDPLANRWTVAGSLDVGRARHTATLLGDGRVLVIGGLSVQTKPYLTSAEPESAEIYDPQTNRWSYTAAGSVARQGHTATLLRDGRVLVVGGMGGEGLVSAVQLYDPRGDGWSTAWEPPTLRSGHTATRLPDGKVLVLGGVGAFAIDVAQGPMHYGTAPLSTGELYDPVLNLWTPIQAMNTTRIEHTATLLKDGRVLVVGGAYANPGHPEVYEPSANRWVPGSVIISRHRHTATLLPDGRVLIVGGYGIDAMSTAWVYRSDSAGPAVNRWGAVPTALVLLGGLALLLFLIWGGGRPRLPISRWLNQGDPDQWVTS